MSRRIVDTPGRNERREDALRPNPYLGYGRDHLALHLMHRGALGIAESQFRRAVWLNPYEPAFKAHLAECLYRRHDYAEARDWAAKALDQDPGNAGCRELLSMIEQCLASVLPEPAQKEDG
jgi:cytochrome c-type biogenesis protein CcmH/NrfG